jgi:hypothetical protein
MENGECFAIEIPLLAPNSILQQITANSLVAKGFFITGYSTTTCMQPEKKTEKLPLLPVLAGAMILIPLLLATGCTGQAPEPQLSETDGP